MNKMYEEKIIFCDNEFEYEFDEKEYIITIYTKNQSDLKSLINKNIKKIYGMKNIILKSNNGHHEWYIERCISAMLTEIKFKVKYWMEYFKENTKFDSLKITSMAFKNILHPSKYFYFRRDEAKSDILYSSITMKEFVFEIDNIKMNLKIIIGDLLESGIVSDLEDGVKILIKSENILKDENAIRVIECLKSIFQILLMNKSISLKRIDLIKDNYIIGRIHEKELENPYNISTINLFFNDILMKLFQNFKIIENMEYRFLEDTNKELIFFYLCRAFEQNFKIRFPNFKVTKRTEKEEIIIETLLEKLEENEEDAFVKGLKHKLEIYKNTSFEKIKYAFQYYDEFINSSQLSIFIKDSIKLLKNNIIKKEGEDFYKFAATRINELRNDFAHEDTNIDFIFEDRLLINFFYYIVYIMMLENLKLNKEEIFEILQNTYINFLV